MKPQKLASMANQIATFFRSYPDDEAAAGIRRHLVSFWTQAMRRDLDAWIEQGATDLDPLVVSALKRPITAASPVVRVTSPAREAGQMASDAG